MELVRNNPVPVSGNGDLPWEEQLASALAL
jgi:hypothetical protein